MGGKRVRRPEKRRLAQLLAAAVVAAGGLAWALAVVDRDAEPEAGARDEAGGPTEPTASASPPVTAAPATPAKRSGKVAEAPKELWLPSGTRLPVRAVTTRPDGVLDVPEDVRTAGWWRGGSRLNDPFGATLIAAHIDSKTQGLGPYVELLRVERDDRIVVRSAHLVQHFRVSSLRLVPRSSLADVTDIFSASGPRRLVMVTCAGPFDESRGGYQNLAIVTARAASAPTRREADR